MPLLPLYVSITRTMTFCAIGLFVASSSFGQDSHPMDYIRSTRPLKSGGSITSHTNRGQKRSWVNQSNVAQPSVTQPNAAQPNAAQPNAANRETGFSQGATDSSTSFYRQAQGGNTAAGSYPYPGASLPAAANTGSRFESNQQAELRFERAATQDRTTGDLGNTENSTSSASLPASFGSQSASQAPAARVAQLSGGSQSRTAAAAQSVAGSQSRSVVNPNVAAGNYNYGPNYANPALNFAGYQGYQANAVAANSVPALNTNVAARVAQNCNCAQSCNCCVTNCQQPRVPAFQPFPVNTQAAAAIPTPGFQVPQLPQTQGFQFQQPNIGVPQLAGNTGGGSGLFSSLFSGSGQYTPLFQFRNMPPGSYLGQGLIGQPTAYVDGQPVRNLLRYIAP